MLDNYFQFNSLPPNLLLGSYDLRLVILSYMVAVFASYIALDLTGRLRDIDNTRTENLSWLIGGSIAMGAGIWSMHFIGMLSFNIPGMTLKYDTFWTVVSLIVAVMASGFALFLLKSSVYNLVHLVAGGVILGLAIASMHYTGMAAMLISLDIRYLPNIFFLSILVAIVASEAAIWLALKSNSVVLRLRQQVKAVSAIIMGLAICGMHYTGMFASVFTPLCEVVPNTNEGLDPAILSMIIATLTFAILSVAFYASSYKESISQQKWEQARELGMAEISASVLHNVGNVLNSINVSIDSLKETVNNSPLSSLNNMSALLNEHQHHLGEFITSDERGKHTLEFINELTATYNEEKQIVTAELNELNKNIQFIKDIISTQQTLSKKNVLDQLVRINELLNEAIAIAGLEFDNSIIIDKQYATIALFLIDKTKILQVFVNLLKNAKDALLESSNTEKKIIITTELKGKDVLLIKITDNGIGIAPANLNKIFNFGFTTKEKGHGFGLHASALSVHELGGSIHAHSKGMNEGTTFSIELPYQTKG
jgi:NO-binding membrane sensor protein with MHYT domain/two-component sensor histidine kinase